MPRDGAPWLAGQDRQWLWRKVEAGDPAGLVRALEGILPDEQHRWPETYRWLQICDDTGIDVTDELDALRRRRPSQLDGMLEARVHLSLGVDYLLGIGGIYCDELAGPQQLSRALASWHDAGPNELALALELSALIREKDDDQSAVFTDSLDPAGSRCSGDLPAHLLWTLHDAAAKGDPSEIVRVVDSIWFEADERWIARFRWLSIANRGGAVARALLEHEASMPSSVPSNARSLELVDIGRDVLAGWRRFRADGLVGEIRLLRAVELWVGEHPEDLARVRRARGTLRRHVPAVLPTFDIYFDAEGRPRR